MDKKDLPGCLGFLAPLLRLFLGPLPNEEKKKLPGSSESIEYPYERIERLLTPAERSFFGVLNLACRKRGVFISCKVRLADLVSVRKGAEQPRAAFNRIQSKHLDFVICRATDTEPLVAIELDDKSHSQKGRVKRDEFLEACLQSAGLPLHREKAAKAYSPEAVKAALEPYFPAN